MFSKFSSVMAIVSLLLQVVPLGIVETTAAAAMTYEALPSWLTAGDETAVRAPGETERLGDEVQGDLVTTTDAFGGYRFTGLPQGTHKVTLDLSTLPDNLRPPEDEVSPVVWINPDMALTSEATSTGVRFRVVYDRASGDIAGVVFHDEDGDGLQDAAEPGLADVKVIDPTIHQYFVPFDDRDLWILFTEKNVCHTGAVPSPTPISPLISIVFLTSGADNTTYYYDHWEDGYDPDPLTPGPTTEQGVLQAGETRRFEDDIDPALVGVFNPAPGVPTYYHDGRDRITIFGENAQVVRFAHPETVDYGYGEDGNGVISASAWEVPQVSDWGTTYIATVGEDLDVNGVAVDDHDYTGLEVMAWMDNTDVYYNGTFVVTLNAGEVYFVEGNGDGTGVQSSDMITGSAPIQVQMMTGSCGGVGISAHGYTLQPVDVWDDAYWAPVPGFDAACVIDDYDTDTDIYLHNPNGADLDVTVESGALVQIVQVPPRTTVSVLAETGWEDLSIGNQGTHLTATDIFWGMVVVDSSSSGGSNSADFDWGHSLIPESQLSSQVVVGHAPGNDAEPPTDNSNLAFVTAVTDTMIYVDLDEDGNPDVVDLDGDGDADDLDVYGIADWDEPDSANGIPILMGQSLRIGDPNDRDLDGAIIYTADLGDRIAVAWGQDACQADRVTPYLDLGYTVLPVNVPQLSKVDALAIDADGSGSFSPGDTITYTMVLFNNGQGSMNGIVLTDSLPYTYTDFVVGSLASSQPPSLTEFSNDGIDFTATENPDIQAFRMFWDTLGPGDAITITFRAFLRLDIPPEINEITNQSVVDSENSDPVDSVDTDDVLDPDTDSPVGQPLLSIDKQVIPTVVEPGDLIAYTVVVSNYGTGVALPTTISDVLPSWITYVPGSLDLTWPVEVGGGAPLVYLSSTDGDPVAYDPPTMVFTDGLRLPAGGYLTATFEAQVSVPLTDDLSLANTACVAAPNWINVLEPPCDTASVEVVSSHTLDIDKAAVTNLVMPGDLLTYTLTYTVSGNSPAPNVIITDEVPFGTTFVAATGGISVDAPPVGGTGVVTWTLGDLLVAGSGITFETGVVTLVVRVEGDWASDPILNTAFIFDDTDESDSDDETTTYVYADVWIQKAVAPDTPVLPGDVITWTLLYGNQGTAPAVNVFITDTLPADVTFGGVVDETPPIEGPEVTPPYLTWRIPTLAPDATGTIVITGTVDGIPVPDGILSNYVAITTDTQESDTTNNESATETPVVGLAVSKQAWSSPVMVGEQVNYTIVVTNTGGYTLTTVPVTDNYDPTYLEFVSAIPDVSSYTPGELRWDDVGPLVPGEVATILVTFNTLTSTQGQSTTNSVVASGTYDGVTVPEVEDTEDISILAPGLSIEKSLITSSPVAAGEAVIFEIVVTNVGDTVLATVPLTDSYDASYLGFVSATPAEDAFVPGMITWDNVGPIPVGGQVVVTVNFTALDSTQALNGDVTLNTATASATDEFGNPLSPVSDDAEVAVLAPALAITKTLVSTTPVLVGKPITYQIVLENVGDTVLVTVPLTDSFDADYLAFVDATPDVDSASAGLLTWDNVGPIPVGAQVVVDVSFTVLTTTQALPGQVTYNTAIASATDEFGAPVSPVEDDATVEVVDTGLVVQKTLLTDDPTIVGNTVTFQIVLMNVGDTVLSTVPLTDTYDPDYLEFVDATPDEDFAMPGMLAWDNVGPIPVGEQVLVSVSFTALTSTQGLLPPVTVNTVDTSATDENGDPVQTVTDDATVRILRPALEMVKTVTPGVAVPNAPITYVIAITNTGDVTFDPLVLTDTLPSDDFHYILDTGVPLDPDIIAEPTLVWQNLGPFAPGERIEVSFAVTVTPGITGTFWNVATVEGVYPNGSIIDSDDVPVSLYDPGVAIDKQVMTPGQDMIPPNLITFTIHITNTGISTIDVLPMWDSYDPAYLSFVSADPMPDEPEDDGLLAWYDLTAPPPDGMNGFGRNLPPGDTFVVTTVFRIVQTITETTNVAGVSDVVDIYGNDANEDEDEELVVYFDPTAVDLLYFHATRLSTSVQLSWATTLEVDNFGFRLLRATVPDISRANEIAFVPSQCRANLCGATYTYVDEIASLDEDAWYWLVDVDVYGQETLHGPVSPRVDSLAVEYAIFVPLVMRP